MITPNAAIDKAIAFLGSLNPELLGGKPQDVRLETIHLFEKGWIAMLSYEVTVKQNGEVSANEFLKALSTRRYIKEFEIDGESGEIIGMKNPLAPSRATERLAA